MDTTNSNSDASCKNNCPNLPISSICSTGEGMSSTQLTRDPCILHNSHSDYSHIPRPSHPSVCLLQSGHFKSICQHQGILQLQHYSINTSTSKWDTSVHTYWNSGALYVTTLASPSDWLDIVALAVNVSKTWSKSIAYRPHGFKVGLGFWEWG